MLLAIVNWDGGGGDLLWSNPLNWSGDLLPGADDDVIVFADETITHNAGSTHIGSLELRTSLSLTGGVFTVDGTFYVSGSSFITATGSGVTLTARGTAVIDGASLHAIDGGAIDLAGVTRYEVGATAGTSLRATGPGSELSLPNLTTIGSAHGAGWTMIEALEGGLIELPQATEVTAGRIRFRADGTESRIDLSLLESLAGDSYGANNLAGSFVATDGGHGYEFWATDGSEVGTANSLVRRRITSARAMHGIRSGLLGFAACV